LGLVFLILKAKKLNLLRCYLIKRRKNESVTRRRVDELVGGDCRIFDFEYNKE